MPHESSSAIMWRFVGLPSGSAIPNARVGMLPTARMDEGRLGSGVRKSGRSGSAARHSQLSTISEKHCERLRLFENVRGDEHEGSLAFAAEEIGDACHREPKSRDAPTGRLP